jgi:hypothetical protein
MSDCTLSRRPPIYIRLTEVRAGWAPDLGWVDYTYDPDTWKAKPFAVDVSKYMRGLLADVTGWRFRDADDGSPRRIAKSAEAAGGDSYWVLETLEEIEWRIRMAMVGRP